MNPIVNIDEIDAQVKSQGYYIFKNAETIAMAEAARAEYFATFRDYPLHYGGFTYADLQKGPIRKKNISSSNGLGEAYAQVMQTLYYPQQHKHSAIAAVFDFMVRVRNEVTEKALDYGDNPAVDRFWNANRIHHYPRGGGFMVRHRDTYFPAVLGARSFLQMLFLMSKKGEDFETGGGHVVDLAGTVIDTEDAVGFGGLIFFDGRIPHGVTDVDPQAEFLFNVPSGRLAAVANLYEYRDA